MFKPFPPSSHSFTFTSIEYPSNLGLYPFMKNMQTLLAIPIMHKLHELYGMTEKQQLQYLHHYHHTMTNSLYLFCFAILYASSFSLKIQSFSQRPHFTEPPFQLAFPTFIFSFSYAIRRIKDAFTDSCLTLTYSIVVSDFACPA